MTQQERTQQERFDQAVAIRNLVRGVAQSGDLHSPEGMECYRMFGAVSVAELRGIVIGLNTLLPYIIPVREVVND